LCTEFYPTSACIERDTSNAVTLVSGFFFSVSLGFKTLASLNHRQRNFADQLV
jgi:hypothetical protein